MPLTRKQKVLLALGFLLLVACSSLLTIYFASAHFFVPPPVTEAPTRDIPFARQDAVNVCQRESAERFSGRLLRSSADWRSTRYESERGVFVVLLDGAVGNQQDHVMATIYCYVEPDTHEISYFKAYDENDDDMFSGGISMEGMMKALGGGE